MSRFFSDKYANLTPYVPGEQPQGRQFVKLNTNESPFPPSPSAQRRAAEAAGKLELYSDPKCKVLADKMAQTLGVAPEQIIFSNGSDEILNFAFMAFCDESHPAVFPDITYGFYEVWAQLNNVPYTKIPLKDDFTIDISDYTGRNETIFIANPNAPTGLTLSLAQIEQILKTNPNNVVVIDEAYVDFAGESAIALLPRYENLLVIQTFSKSRSMAGGRLGLAVGNKGLIDDLNALKFSTNPFNVNAMTMAAGLGALEDVEYFKNNCRAILENRAFTTRELRSLGFTVIDSSTNFVLATHPKLDGKELYLNLKEKGILVRHFDTPRLKDYNRITIGSREQMDCFLTAVKQIMEEVL